MSDLVMPEVGGLELYEGVRQRGWLAVATPSLPPARPPRHLHRTDQLASRLAQRLPSTSCEVKRVGLMIL